MKRILVFNLLLIFGCFAQLGLSQNAVFCPLDVTGLNSIPGIFSAPSANVMWTGMFGFSSTNSKNYGFTTNSGTSFTLAAVPEPLNRGFAGIYALNSDTVWAGLTDFNGSAGGAVWKTNNAGTSWTQQTTTEFAGGFLNSICFFNADSGLAVGDPNGGYFEIYTTSNGGTSWLRVSQMNIPSPLTNEYGYVNKYSKIGNRVWFSTSAGRVYRSYDKGYNWSVSTVDSTFTSCAITMNDSINGVAHNDAAASSYVKVTHDGGISWTTQNLTQTLSINNVSSLPNSGSSYVFKNYPFNIYATSDNFATYSSIAFWNISYYDILMFNHSIGWTQSAGPDWTQSIVKIQNLTTGLISNESNLLDTKLFPNPITSDAGIVTYTLKDSREVKISLFDLTGKLIKVSEVKSEIGLHSVVFDFKDVSKGIYLLQVSNGLDSSKIKVLRL